MTKYELKVRRGKGDQTIYHDEDTIEIPDNGRYHEVPEEVYNDYEDSNVFKRRDKNNASKSGKTKNVSSNSSGDE
jgi:hypothetical protein